MAWIGEDTFESYSTGDLHGENGGTGWASAWSGSTQYDVSTTNPDEGSNCVTVTADGEVSMTRELTTAVASGIFYISMRNEDVDKNFALKIYTGGYSGQLTTIFFHTTGYIRAYNGGTLTNISASTYTTNQWYRIGIEIHAGDTPTFDWNIDGGSWTTGWAYQVDGGAEADNSVDRLTFEMAADNTGTAAFDFISPNYTSSVDYPLTAAVGTFTLTGIAASINAALTMVASLGTFTLTGFAAALKFGYGILAALGTFTLTGIDAAITSTRTLTAAVGAFTLTGIAANITRGIKIVANVGAFILTGFKARIGSGAWVDRTKPTTSYTERSKPSTSYTDRTKPTTNWIDD